MGELEEVLEEYYFKNLKANSDLELLELDNKENKLQLLQSKTFNNIWLVLYLKSNKFFNFTYTTTPLIPEIIIDILYKDSLQLEFIF